jgi:hypothetical protein
MVAAQFTAPRPITAVHPMSVTEKVHLYDLIHECVATEQPMVVLYNTGDAYLTDCDRGWFTHVCLLADGML